MKPLRINGSEPHLVPTSVYTVPPLFRSHCIIALFFIMAPIRLLGYAHSTPCTFAVDHSIPCSRVSSEYLYEHSFSAVLNSKGQESVRLTIMVPSQGGYYTSVAVPLVPSMASNNANIVLGADWVSSCRIRAGSNVLLDPSIESTMHLSDGHSWTADGMLTSWLICVVAETCPSQRRYFPCPYNILAGNGTASHENVHRPRKPICRLVLLSRQTIMPTIYKSYPTHPFLQWGAT